MTHKKKRQRDIVRYGRWLRTRDIYPDLTFGEFLRNGPRRPETEGNYLDRHRAEAKSR